MSFCIKCRTQQHRLLEVFRTEWLSTQSRTKEHYTVYSRQHVYVGIMEVVTVLGPAHILRQVLMSKYRVFNI